MPVLSENLSIPKPIIKWVGGKTQLIDKLLPDFPIEINNYREVFLGGGSVLFAVLSYIQHGYIHIHESVYAYDVNEPLIYMYKNIQTAHEELYAEIKVLIDEFKTCGNSTEINRNPPKLEDALKCRENYYYWIRGFYNKMNVSEKRTIKGSAMFIFMNKTCFRGVFRVGPNGFNVPYGHYNNPEIINKEHLDEIHKLIQGVVFECKHYVESLHCVKEGDYLYLDPPYVPETPKSFVGYTENGFNTENHTELFDMIHMLSNLCQTDPKMVGRSSELYGFRHFIAGTSINDILLNQLHVVDSIKYEFADAKSETKTTGIQSNFYPDLEIESNTTKRHIRFMMSNSDVELVRKHFTNEKYRIQTVLCKRTIHSKKPESKTNELIITNY